ncbi:MAG TPA: LysR family transcriptional regulator [Paucimonas sp.]|nr:LysR family transcriptional regulator [Paucimonas sp.]
MPSLLEIRTLLAVASAGSLSRAAREMEVSVAMVSKRMDALESRLGVRLLIRTPRCTGLTLEGERYVLDCRRILDDLQEADSAVSQCTTELAGLVRVSAGPGFGRRILTPLLVEFGNIHPRVHVQLCLSDALVDLGSGRHDLAIRVGPLQDSGLISLPLVRNRRLVVGAPAYLASHGRPQTPRELLAHNCIVLRGSSEALLEWRFVGSEGTIDVPIRGRLSVDNGDMQHELALAGAGLTLKSVWDVADDLAHGRLEALLPDYPCPSSDIQIVYLDRHFQPARVRALAAFLRDRLVTRESEVLALLPPGLASQSRESHSDNA